MFRPRVNTIRGIINDALLSYLLGPHLFENNTMSLIELILRGIDFSVEQRKVVVTQQYAAHFLCSLNPPLNLT